MQQLKNLENKEILILGLGVEGLSTYSFLRQEFPHKKLLLADKKEKENLSPEAQEIFEKDSLVEVFLGPSYLKNLSSIHVIIKTPGIPVETPELQNALKQGISITSQTELFLSEYREHIIGVTGTKGKSTTSSLIFHILKTAGRDVYLIGNIGTPPFLLPFEKITAETVFVYELSSHQLRELRVSPHIALILNIVPEHLDYYPDFSSYVKAKESIVRYQKSTDFMVVNPTHKTSLEVAQKSAGKKIFFQTDTQNKWNSSLLGDFNQENITASVAVARIMDINEEKIKKAVATFEGLPARLERVGTFYGITFYDDSLATIPEATVGALEALGDQVDTLITGGYDRKQDFAVLGKAIDESNLSNVILFPTTGTRIWEAVEKEAKRKAFFVSSMKEAVEIAFGKTPRGKICLLSNASASFNMFIDYKDKSAQYRKYIKELGT